MSVNKVVEAAVVVGRSRDHTATRQAVNKLIDTIDTVKPGVEDEVVEQILDLAYDLKRHIHNSKQFDLMKTRLQQVVTVRLQ